MYVYYIIVHIYYIYSTYTPNTHDPVPTPRR